MEKNIQTISPIDNSVYVERDYATQDDINQVLESAKAGQKTWKATPLPERKQLCSKAVDAFVANKEAIAEEICLSSVSCCLEEAYLDGTMTRLGENLGYHLEYHRFDGDDPEVDDKRGHGTLGC